MWKQEQGANYGEKILNYWKPGSLMLTDPTAFLDSLMKYDKEAITEDIIKKLKRFITNPDYEPDKIKRVNIFFSSRKGWIAKLSITRSLEDIGRDLIFVLE